LRSSFRFTYNFTNQSTQYQNGVDMAASAAFSKSVISRLMHRSSEALEGKLRRSLPGGTPRVTCTKRQRGSTPTATAVAGGPNEAPASRHRESDARWESHS